VCRPGTNLKVKIVPSIPHRGYTAHAQKIVPNARLLSAEIAATRPLETVMAEKVAALRTWAEGRTVAAD
jgi:hypothetical protein